LQKKPFLSVVQDKFSANHTNHTNFLRISLSFLVLIREVRGKKFFLNNLNAKKNTCRKPADA